MESGFPLLGTMKRDTLDAAAAETSLILRERHNPLQMNTISGLRNKRGYRQRPRPKRERREGRVQPHLISRIWAARGRWRRPPLEVSQFARLSVGVSLFERYCLATCRRKRLMTRVLNAVALQPSIQRGFTDAENPGGLAAAATGVGQGIANGAFFVVGDA